MESKEKEVITMVHPQQGRCCFRAAEKEAKEKAGWVMQVEKPAKKKAAKKKEG